MNQHKQPKLEIPGIFIFILAITVLFSCTENDNQVRDTTGMLQHNVYFYLKPEVTAAQNQEFVKGLRELISISSIHHAEIGRPGATEKREVVDHSFAYSIFTWFSTLEDHEVYQNHPDHKLFIEKYKDLWASVKVYDSEIIR
ncbi:MAG: Dabb family protein [Cyclobacteriaceae bacterium]|nr:Dabb family protein [Cyclobacteriaceae bacterium]